MYHKESMNIEKKEIIRLIKKAEKLTPNMLEPNLEPNQFSNVPEWHDYELKIWEIGEQIRKIILKNKTLRNDNEINDLIIKFCLNRNSKRGRQSFVSLLGYKHLANYAEKLILLIDDDFVNGHIIDTIYKMQVKGFKTEIERFTTSKINWIKKIANKYIIKYGT